MNFEKSSVVYSWIDSLTPEEIEGLLKPENQNTLRKYLNRFQLREATGLIEPLFKKREVNGFLVQTYQKQLTLLSWIQSLSNLEAHLLAENQLAVREYIRNFLPVKDLSVFFIPVSDTDALEVKRKTVIEWRILATRLGYSGPIVFRVIRGYKFFDHGIEVEQSPGFTNDFKKSLQNETTVSEIVLFIPRFILETTTPVQVKEKASILLDFRKRYGLPEHHLNAQKMGKASVLAGLCKVIPQEHLESPLPENIFLRTGSRVFADPLLDGVTAVLSFRSGKIRCRWVHPDYDDELQTGFCPFGEITSEDV